MTLSNAPANPPGAVVVPIPRFTLQVDEPLAHGLKRLSLNEIEIAVSGFYEGEESFRLAVHEARKSIKRIRALLRLVRSEIGEKAFRYENSALRDTGRLLSSVRSAAVTADGIEDIARVYGSLLAQGTFGELTERLVIRRDQTEERVMEDPELIPKVVANLERAHGRYSSWPTDPEARPVYGVGIRNTYQAVGPGLRLTYRRGRREMVAAYRSPVPATFHSWRKRTKYFRHQLEILTPLWPEVVLGMALTLERIGDLLGEDHDLAEILSLVSERPDLCPNPVERSLLNALVSQRRSDLQTACRVLGKRIYAESPDSLSNRFAAYWESADLARSITLTSISF